MARRLSSNKKRLIIFFLTIFTILLAFALEESTDYNWGGHILVLVNFAAYYFLAKYIWDYQKKKKHKSQLMKDLKVIKDLRDIEP
jgi:hypothetical protein